MSTDASREAFEAWLAGHDPRSFCPNAYWEHDYKWKAWQASRKQALADAEALCRSLDNGDRQTTPTNCAEEIEVLK